MAFDIVEMPSGSILIKGKLVQKKLTAKSKRLVMLCFPKTLEDVQVLFEHLTLTNKETGQLAGLTEEDQREASNKDMEIFGHISLAAISGFPLLVIGTNARTYIHFSQIQGLYDEEDLGQACCFSILTAQSEFRFVSETSTGYQKWVGALTQAFENMSTTTPNELYANTQQVDSPNGDAASTLSRPTSAMSRDPSDYIEVHRAISTNRANSRRSLSQKRQDMMNTHQQNQYYDYPQHLDYYPPPPKKSTWSKVKNAFGAFKNKINPDFVSAVHENDMHRGRSLPPAHAAYEYVDQDGLPMDRPPIPPPKTPRRRKSIARYLGFEE